MKLYQCVHVIYMCNYHSFTYDSFIVILAGPSQTPTAHLYYKVGGLMFELVLAYPLTLSPITIEVIIGDETYSKTALLSTDNRRLTADFDVSVTMTTQVEYKILFDGSSLIQSSVVLSKYFLKLNYDNYILCFIRTDLFLFHH